MEKKLFIMVALFVVNIAFAGILGKSNKDQLIDHLISSRDTVDGLLKEEKELVIELQAEVKKLETYIVKNDSVSVSVANNKYKRLFEKEKVWRRWSRIIIVSRLGVAPFGNLDKFKMLTRFNLYPCIDSTFRWQLENLVPDTGLIMGPAEEMGFSKYRKIRGLEIVPENPNDYMAAYFPPVEYGGRKWQLFWYLKCQNPAYRFVCETEVIEVEVMVSDTDTVYVESEYTRDDYIHEPETTYIEIEKEKPSEIRAKPEVHFWAGSYDGIFPKEQPRLQWVGWYGGGQVVILVGRTDSYWSFGPIVMNTYWRGVSRNYREFQGDRFSFGPIIDWTKPEDGGVRGTRFNFAPQWGWLWSHDWSLDSSDDERQRSFMLTFLTTFNKWNKNLAFESYFDASFDLHNDKTEGIWLPTSRSALALGWKFFFLRFGPFRLGAMNKNFYTFDDHGWTIGVGPVLSIWDVVKAGNQWDFSFNSEWEDCNGRSAAITLEVDLSRIFTKVKNAKSKNKKTSRRNTSWDDF